MARVDPDHQPRRLLQRGPAVARAVLAGTAAILLAVTVSPAAVGQPVTDQAAAATADQGVAPAYLRTAHLVSDLGMVDVRLSTAGTPGASTSREGGLALAESASYGAIGAYSAVAPERYAVSVRRAGEGLGGDPLLASPMMLEPGRAYTVMAVGEPGSAALQLLEDDLTPPPSGRAEVRLVSAAPGARVSVGGVQVMELASSKRASDYVEVEAGKHVIEVDDGTTSTTQEVGLVSRSSYTLFATPGADGSLQVLTVLDQAATEVVPAGGIETGGGWLATQVPSLRLPSVVIGLGAAGLLLAMLVVPVVLRRRTAQPFA